MTITNTTTDRFDPLRGQLTGCLVTPADESWDLARAAWIVNADQRPAGVVQAEGAADVAATVAFARKHGLRVAPQESGTLTRRLV